MLVLLCLPIEYHTCLIAIYQDVHLRFQYQSLITKSKQMCLFASVTSLNIYLNPQLLTFCSFFSRLLKVDLHRFPCLLVLGHWNDAGYFKLCNLVRHITKYFLRLATAMLQHVCLFC